MFKLIHIKINHVSPRLRTKQNTIHTSSIVYKKEITSKDPLSAKYNNPMFEVGQRIIVWKSFQFYYR